MSVGALARTSAAEEKAEFTEVPIPEVQRSGGGESDRISRATDAYGADDVPPTPGCLAGHLCQHGFAGTQVGDSMPSLSVSIRPRASPRSHAVRVLGRTDWQAPGAAQPFAAGSLVAVGMTDLMRSDWSQVRLPHVRVHASQALLPPHMACRLLPRSQCCTIARKLGYTEWIGRTTHDHTLSPPPQAMTLFEPTDSMSLTRSAC